MENVTKALLIAAAVIVVLVIIGLGMYYLNIGKDAMKGGTETLDMAQVQKMNADMENYAGTQTGATVKKLVEIINAHNARYADESDFCILINDDSTAAITDAGATTASKRDYERPDGKDASGVVFTTGNIKAANRYRVMFDYTSAGYIANCRIKKVN